LLLSPPSISCSFFRECKSCPACLTLPPLLAACRLYATPVAMSFTLRQPVKRFVRNNNNKKKMLLPEICSHWIEMGVLLMGSIVLVVYMSVLSHVLYPSMATNTGTLPAGQPDRHLELRALQAMTTTKTAGQSAAPVPLQDQRNGYSDSYLKGRGNRYDRTGTGKGITTGTPTQAGTPSEAGKPVRQQAALQGKQLPDRVKLARTRASSPERVTHADMVHDVPYDIYDCPPNPPPNYPMAWMSIQILTHWPVDQTSIPSDRIYQGLCVFDWNQLDHQERAQIYRAAELPFVLRHHPEPAQTAVRWSQPSYLQAMLGSSTKYRNDYSPNNHMSFTTRTSPSVRLSYSEWSAKASALDRLTDPEQARSEHHYFRWNAALPSTNAFMFDEMPYLFSTPPDSSSSNSLFLVDPAQASGTINCRLGMRGTFTRVHLDPIRNWIVLLQGQRRYLLAHPDQCGAMELDRKLGEGGRVRSPVNWSNVTDATYRGPFGKALLNEVVMHPGDALYLPTSWFHAIVSLTTNAQCNSRSGRTFENDRVLRRCGLPV
jgi:Cupin-like domain